MTLRGTGPRARTGGLALGTLACLVGCMAAPVAPETAVAPPAPAAPAAATVGTPLAQQWVFDVDPVRASAFERPADTAPAVWPLGVYMPAVAHDLTSGKTTVTLQVASAGQPVTDLALTVGGDRPLAAPAPALAPLSSAEDTRTVALVFDNPAAEPFSVTLDFAGRALPAESVPTRRVQAVGPTATASSSYSGYAPARAVDGNLGTEWTDGGYRAAEASLTLDMGAEQTLTSLKAKLKPQSGGAYYRIEVSSNGTAFTPVTGNLKNTSWNLETKALPAGTQGRYLRLHFFNDAASPETRFSVFEAQVTGTATGGTPTPTPTPVVTPTPPAATPPPPTGTGNYGNTFESYALGTDPADFIDPNNEGYSYSWMPRVRWRVADYQGSRQYMHDGLNQKAYLNFRRYKGTALGTANGLLPARYFAEAKVTPIQSYTYAPTGDQGTQHYYVDPTHYVELLIKPNLFEVWVCNNAQPFTSQGWQRLYFTSVSNPAGTARRLGAEVDANTHTIKAYLDGVLKTTQTHAMLSTQPHWFALRGTGNVVVHDNVRIERR